MDHCSADSRDLDVSHGLRALDSELGTLAGVGDIFCAPYRAGPESSLQEMLWALDMPM